jgi:predicted metal-dependent hydrolase
MNETFNFNYGDETINCLISRHNINKIQIKVKPNFEVIARAPQLTTITDIRNALVNKANWIYQQLSYFRHRQQYVVTKEYVSGEMMFYLGKHYVLKVISDKTADFKVKITNNRLQVNLIEQSINKQQQVKQLVTAWYKSQAEQVFSVRLAKITPQIDWLDQPPKLRISAVQKQWGSYSSSGKLMLNMHLIKAPTACIDYIIVHELCHIIEKNHSNNFWNLVTQTMPYWRKAKQQLDNLTELYLNE